MHITAFILIYHHTNSDIKNLHIILSPMIPWGIWSYESFKIKCYMLLNYWLKNINDNHQNTYKVQTSNKKLGLDAVYKKCKCII